MFNITEILENTFRQLIDQLTIFLPNLIKALILLLVGVLLAKIIRFIMIKVLEKSGVDKLGESLNKISVIKNFGELKISKVSSQIVYFYILMIFITSSSEVLGLKVLTDMVQSMAALIPKLIVAAIMLLIGIYVAEALKEIIVKVCKSLNIASGRLIGNIIFGFFLIISLIASLKQAQIETSLLESSFNIIIAGVIFAFALGYGISSKDVLSNIISSFYSKEKYKEGQTISINGTKGTITAIDTTSITLLTPENKVVFPFSVLQTEKVVFFD